MHVALEANSAWTKKKKYLVVFCLFVSLFPLSGGSLVAASTTSETFQWR